MNSIFIQRNTLLSKKNDRACKKCPQKLQNMELKQLDIEPNHLEFSTK